MDTTESEMLGHPEYKFLKEKLLLKIAKYKERKYRRVNICLVGSSGVGKTSFVRFHRRNTNPKTFIYAYIL